MGFYLLNKNSDGNFDTNEDYLSIENNNSNQQIRY